MGAGDSFRAPAAVLGVLVWLVAGTSVQAQTQSDQIKRGEYLTRAADCAACHTAPDGREFAGGYKFSLPFGTIYGPNITPDKQTGIGDYTDDEFVAAIQRGVGRGGKHLYPAMPYTNYTLMSREDALAIKAYLFSLPAVNAATPQSDLKFPYNQRWLMVFWNMLNNPDKRFQPDQSKSAEWNQGFYLAEALGHCQQCHTPRNFMFGLKGGQAYAGTPQQDWLAYNITNDKQSGIGAWSDQDLESYLSTGHAPGHGAASGPMARRWTIARATSLARTSTRWSCISAASRRSRTKWGLSRLPRRSIRSGRASSRRRA